jgi:hypothetical protein
MKDPYQSGFVWSLRSDIANFVYSEYAKNPRGFVNLINNELTRIKSIGFIKSPDDIVSKPNFYPLEISYLKKRVIGRIMFLGDGLNAIHPVAGQAFNMAVNDIKIIRDNIKTNLSLGLDFGIESYLKSGSFDILKNHLSLNFSTSSSRCATRDLTRNSCRRSKRGAITICSSSSNMVGTVA